MHIANGVEMLELEMQFMGRSSTIHPTVLFDEQTAILVDTGMPGHADGIADAMAKAGVPFDRLKAIVFTHQDIDHIGGIESILHKLGRPVDIYAHTADKPYIEGDKEPIKMNRARVEQMLANVPEADRARIQAMFSKVPTAKITHTVADGDVLPFFGGLTVIFTPGHTPGHISLYVNRAKVLITGDATTSTDGQIQGPNEHATPDMALALESQKKFTQFDIEKVICYHGGLVDDNPNQQFRNIIVAF